ncbi:MAG: hypothetical protein R3351_09370, partial [Nitrospirales bacterium]|nr:hypothetical protein [Nitrospirales bacterium]
SPRDRRAGIAEAVKVALIKDFNFFCWIEEHAQELNAFAPDAMSLMIRRCAELHMRHIAQGDPFETGNVRPLDYGHWAAHKLESLTNHELRHGEAVAMGMAIDTRYAAQIGLLSEDIEHRILQLLENLGFELWHPMMQATSPRHRFLLTEGLREFREHLGGTLSITLLTQIGQCLEVQEIDELKIEHAVHWLKARQPRL